MPNQPAFPDFRDAMKNKQRRRERFLTEMDVVVPGTVELASCCRQVVSARSGGGLRDGAS
jgi:hypothetical protein